MVQWDEAVVDDRKILDYLLAVEHPVGGDKATFFRSVGYAKGEWTRLRQDLLDLVQQGELVAEQEPPFGVKYVVDGSVHSPVGSTVDLRTVWISDGSDEPPRLVTAYPR